MNLVESPYRRRQEQCIYYYSFIFHLFIFLFIYLFIYYFFDYYYRATFKHKEIKELYVFLNTLLPEKV